MEKIPFLASDIYRTYSFYIPNILFAFKICFFAYKNYNIRIITTSKRFQFYV